VTVGILLLALATVTGLGAAAAVAMGTFVTVSAVDVGCGMLTTLAAVTLLVVRRRSR
jgi:hypothetical protein